MKQKQFHRVGAIEDIEEKGMALRFDIDADEFVSGFVILYGGKLYSYRNRCPHMNTELDWMPGDVFEEEGRYLVCATHGAMFEPTTGKCVSGPCVSQSLTSLPVKLEKGEVWVAF